MPVPVISIAQMREWEKAAWATGQTEADVIRRVGEQIARHARQLTRPGDAVLILAGKGHNGDDARASVAYMQDRQVEVLALSAPETDFPKLDQALARRPALVIDGLFGIGLNRPLDSDWIKLIQRLNAERMVVLAVDVPSGLNADTGEPFGAAVEAAVTLTVGAPKTGLLQPIAWPFVGHLEVTGDVGLSPCPHAGEMNWTLPDDFRGFPPRRHVAGHKGAFGHLAIIAGSFGFHGASVLAARGAQRAQPGLITLLPQEPVYRAVASQMQSVMVGAWSAEAKLPATTSALLIGPGLAAPGLADSMSATTRQFWRDLPLPMIVDASALDWLTPGSTAKNLVRVITPHPGEASRLLKMPVAQVQANRVAALREISRRFGNCWVVLKGHQTLVGRGTGNVFANPSGNPHLAQGGSGDVLAGYLAGLLAQPELQAEPERTIRFAVWQHGAAADALEARHANWIVEDLFGELGNIRAGAP